MGLPSGSSTRPRTGRLPVMWAEPGSGCRSGCAAAGSAFRGTRGGGRRGSLLPRFSGARDEGGRCTQAIKPAAIE